MGRAITSQKRDKITFDDPAKQAPNQAVNLKGQPMPSIVLFRNSTGWCATFRGVADMPDDSLPLPFTVRAPSNLVHADISRRFPGVTVDVDFSR